MIDTETDADWAKQQPQASYIKMFELLQEQGFTEDEQAEVMLTLGLAISNKLHGPRPLAARLIELANKFVAEANRMEREASNASKN